MSWCSQPAMLAASSAPHIHAVLTSTYPEGRCRRAAGYGQREQTRTDHLREVMLYAGWRGVDRLVLKELESGANRGR